MPRTLFDVDDARETTTHARSSANPRRREAIVPVRLTKSERDQLAEVARDLGISLSTYLRQAALSRPLSLRRAVRPIPEVNRETYHALGRLATDVNVMARRMAERRREPGAPDVLEALELVTRFLGTVRADVLGTTLAPEGGES
jgi:mobilization protein NikA